jgi:hypothetical protein
MWYRIFLTSTITLRYLHLRVLFMSCCCIKMRGGCLIAFLSSCTILEIILVRLQLLECIVLLLHLVCNLFNDAFSVPQTI